MGGGGTKPGTVVVGTLQLVVGPISNDSGAATMLSRWVASRAAPGFSRVAVRGGSVKTRFSRIAAINLGDAVAPCLPGEIFSVGHRRTGVVFRASCYE